jgi:hypothetical protein
MALENASVPMGATYAPTGGTARTLKSLGQTLNEHKLWLDDGSSNILRGTLLAAVRPPVPQASAPNGLTQQRITCTYQRPKLLANGKYTTNSVELKVSYDIESAAADINELREIVRHLVTDADFSDLFLAGSTQ